MIVLSMWKGLIEVRPRPVLMSDILREVAEKHGLTLDELMGSSRAQRVARPRQEAMHACRMRTQQSFPAIARLFERDHTTVIHAVRQVEKRLGEQR